MRYRLLSLVVFLVALLAASPGARAQGLYVAGNITAVDAGTCSTAAADVILNLSSSTASVAINVSGTFSGTTLQFATTVDTAAHYVSVNAYPPNSTTAVTSTTGVGTWTVSVPGMASLCVYASAYSTGTATVAMRSTAAISASTRAGGGGGGGGSGTVTAVSCVSGCTVATPTTTPAITVTALSNPMTTLGDTIYGGASGTPTRLAGPTTPNGVPQFKVDIPAAGAAVAEVWQLSGVPVDATNPGTLLVTDRANYLNWTSGTTLALPAVATSFAANFPFLLKNTSTTLTITPNSGASDLIDGAASGTVIPNFAAFVYQDGTTAPGHWFTVKYPTFAAFGSTCTNGLTWSTTTGIGCAASAPQVGPLTGDVTTSGAAATIAANAVTGPKMANNTVTATQLAAQYSKGSCTELWGGSGTSFAMTAGDDAISNNSCYNDSGVTRTITALKCRSDNAANTTVLTPTFGSAGTGTSILTGTVTCGNSYAYSSTGTLANTAWTTGTGIDPGMTTAGNATSIAMIVEYTF